MVMHFPGFFRGTKSLNLFRTAGLDGKDVNEHGFTDEDRQRVRPKFVRANRTLLPRSAGRIAKSGVANPTGTGHIYDRRSRRGRRCLAVPRRRRYRGVGTVNADWRSGEVRGRRSKGAVSPDS